MRHRMMAGTHTGLGGNNSPALIDGAKPRSKRITKLVNACAKDAYIQFFKGTKLDYKYCDAQYRLDEIRVGIEPAYMYEELKVLTLNKNKNCSRFLTGCSFGVWGSGIRSNSKWYRDYKRNSKFVRFVDKWHPILFKQ